MDMPNIAQTTLLLITAFALKVLGAIVVWLIARRVIGYVARLVVRSLKYPFDQTVAGYIGTGVAVLLNVGMILGILGLFGIETTSFAALLAGVGIAIGTAWGGLLANLAAGIFLLTLRPFKIGDFIQAGGVIGTVQEIGLFVTTLDTMDNIRTFVGNNKLLSDNVQNFTANPYRRVDLVAQLHNAVDPAAAVRLLKAGLTRIPHVLTQPAPDVEPELHSPRPGPRGPALLPQRPLLAGLLRRQSADPRDFRGGRLPGPRAERFRAARRLAIGSTCRTRCDVGVALAMRG
jgi:small conductance mechanosensitive channel